MKKTIFKTLTLLFILVMGCISCVQETKPKKQSEKSVENLDTLIVKHKNELSKSYEVALYSKSYTYYWLVGKDTLDFSVTVDEYKRDSTLHLDIYHRQPILFTEVLKKIIECIPSIKEDFYFSKLNSFHFRNIIYYRDLAKDLSNEYEKRFGQRDISYEKLNRFLLSSNLTKQLNNIVSPFDKRVKGYNIEKFHLIDKESFDYYLSNVDLTEYPEFVIDGMGLSVQLETK